MIGGLLALAASLHILKACPGPVSLGTDLSILVHNDLYGINSTRSQSLVIASTPQTLLTASKTCTTLNERLWTPQIDDFLPYLAYQNQNASQVYWAEGGCVNVTIEGYEAVKTPCGEGEVFPVICTNSAGRSSSAKVDNSTYWGVEVEVGGKFVTGIRDKDVFRFTGLRYASQPQRFTHSTPYTLTSNTTALTFGSPCLQSPNIGSEDCLFLNIWTPYLPNSRSPTTQPLKPIMFQIHGGAFTGGQGSDPGLDGTGLASRGDVVVVTINYRLSTLGFLALTDGVTNGNYGLGDQVTALDWVVRNIASFGGDKDRITILGQSAGAGSVRALLASPKTVGKIRGAIMQSNLAGSAYASTYSEYYNISTEYEVAARGILNSTGCLGNESEVDCLRGIDPFVLVNASTPARFVVQDGEYIVTPRLEFNGDGSEPTKNVSVMIGFMRDDGASFISYPHSPTITNVSTELANSGFTQQQLSSSTLDLYPITTGGNVTTYIYNASSLLATDSEFRCLDLATAYSASIHSTFSDIYVYEFNRSYNGYDPNPPVCSAPPSPSFPLGDTNAEYFKCHSGELAYVFGTIAYTGQQDRDGEDIPFSQFVGDSWTSFARKGDPNVDLEWARARGFVNSTKAAEAAGEWRVIKDGEVGVRVWQVPAFEGGTYSLGSKERCDAVGYPLDYYEAL